MPSFSIGALVLVLVFVIVPVLILIAALWGIFTARARRLGYASLVLSLVLFIVGALLLHARDQAEQLARWDACFNNVRQITLAMILYARDHDGQYPPALLDDSEPAQRRCAHLLKGKYLRSPEVFHCPAMYYRYPPTPTTLDRLTLADSSLQSIADCYLNDGWSSYGLDPRITHRVSTSRALLADRPDHRYWGTGVNSPPKGTPGSNSENHRGRSQTIGYNDGHIVRSHTCADDSGIDPNIYASNPDLKPAYDSNIDFGAAPPP